MSDKQELKLFHSSMRGWYLVLNETEAIIDVPSEEIGKLFASAPNLQAEIDRLKAENSKMQKHSHAMLNNQSRLYRLITELETCARQINSVDYDDIDRAYNISAYMLEQIEALTKARGES